MNTMQPDFGISTARARIDVGMVHEFLSSSYWAEGRTRAVVECTIQNSLCFGGYIDGQQVAFGRVVTDFAVIAYILDVFVLPQYRNRGFATAIVRSMLNHPELDGIHAVLLRTRDSHGFYERLGFGPLPRSEEMMSYSGPGR